MGQQLLFKLDQNPKGRGLRCDEEGLFLGRDALLQRDGNGNFEARPAGEIEKILGGAYGDNANWESRVRSVKLVADALNKSDLARAMITAVLMRLPGPGSPISIADVDGVLAKAGFDPDELRDEHGRWTVDGNGSSENVASNVAHRDPRIQLADIGRSDASNDPVAEAVARAAEAARRERADQSNEIAFDGRSDDGRNLQIASAAAVTGLPTADSAFGRMTRELGFGQAWLNDRQSENLPKMVLRDNWVPYSPNAANLSPVQEPYYRITLHHTGDETTAEDVAQFDHGDESTLHYIGRDIKSWLDRGQPAEDSTKNPMGDISYNFLISKDGTIYEGRSLAYMGAHTAGKPIIEPYGQNPGNVGIAFLGNYESKPLTTEQSRSAELLIEKLNEAYGISGNARGPYIFTHAQFDSDRRGELAGAAKQVEKIREYNYALAPYTVR